MRAIVVNEPGAPAVLRLEEVQTPEPSPGEVLIEVVVAGVDFADVGMRAGMVGGPHAVELPYTPGFEVAGVVAAVGEGAEGVAEGDRVAAVLPAGGYAEYAVASAGSVVPIPKGVGFAEASALLVQGLTAYGVLHDSARIGEGDAVLVMAAGGGVGALAVQLAKLAGAGTVVGTAGSREKLDLALSLKIAHLGDEGRPAGGQSSSVRKLVGLTGRAVAAQPKEIIYGDDDRRVGAGSPEGRAKGSRLCTG